MYILSQDCSVLVNPDNVILFKKDKLSVYAHLPEGYTVILYVGATEQDCVDYLRKLGVTLVEGQE